MGKSDIKILIGLFLNLTCSLTIVLINKWLFSIAKFPSITLTCCHFFATSIGVYICYVFKIFEKKHVRIFDVLPLAFTFCGFVVFTNLSLMKNSVGTYQLAKTLTTPMIIYIQTRYYAKDFSYNIKLSMLPIIIGVFINSYYDISFNLEGLIYAIIGVLVTSVYQILVSAKQKQLSISSMQLLFYQAPISTFILSFIILFIEPPWGEGNLFNFNYNINSIILLFASCFTAFFVNLTIYWVIGNTSPVTYNMFGHFKFVCTIIGGFIAFRDEILFRQLCGILMTCFGIYLYTKFKLSENALSRKKSGGQIMNV